MEEIPTVYSWLGKSSDVRWKGKVFFWKAFVQNDYKAMGPDNVYEGDIRDIFPLRMAN